MRSSSSSSRRVTRLRVVSSGATRTSASFSRCNADVSCSGFGPLLLNSRLRYHFYSELSDLASNAVAVFFAVVISGNRFLLEASARNLRPSSSSSLVGPLLDFFVFLYVALASLNRRASERFASLVAILTYYPPRRGCRGGFRMRISICDAIITTGQNFWLTNRMLLQYQTESHGMVSDNVVVEHVILKLFIILSVRMEE